MKCVTEGYEFLLRSFWQVMEPKGSSYGQGTVVPWIHLKLSSATRDIVNPASRVTCSCPRAILLHSKWPIIFELYECNVEELVCTVLSKNNTCAWTNMWVVAVWVINHAKRQVFGCSVHRRGFSFHLD